MKTPKETFEGGIATRLVLLVTFLSVAPDVQAFSHTVFPTAGDYIFYTFAISGILFSAAIIIAYRQFEWLVYVGLALLLLVNNASMDGMLALWLGQSDFVTWVLPYFFTSATTAYGFFLIALRLEKPHRLTRLKKWFVGLAAISALFPMSSGLWLEKVPLSTMWLPVNVLFFLMVLAQVLPPITWQTSDRLLRWLTRAFPVVIALFATGVYLIHFTSSVFEPSQLNQLNRLALIIFAFFSLLIVVWQAVANTRERDIAQRQALEAARNEAQMQLALIQAEQDYENALSIASNHRSRLAGVSHDLKQPISALRMAIDQLQRTENSEGAARLARAVDYIDSLAHSCIDDSVSDTFSEEPGSAHTEQESVATTVFAGALHQMFVDQATEQGVTFKVKCPERQVKVEPLAAMRIMSNLITNALAHAKARRLLVVFRPKGEKVVFQVHDNGCGMDGEALQNALLPGVKGAASEGQGLGLKIVHELCEAQNMPFTMRSTPGRGTSAYVEMGLDQG